jgi:hypothetical protein
MSGVALIFVLFAATPKSFFDFQSNSEKVEFEDYMNQLQAGSRELTFVEGILENLENVRIEIFKADVQRTLMFIVFTAALVMLVLFRALRLAYVLPVMVIVVLGDLWSVDRRYLDNEKIRGQYKYYVRHDDKVMPYHPSFADQFILETEKNSSSSFDETQSGLLAAMKESPIYKGVRNKDLMDSIAAFGALNLTTNFRVLTLQSTFTDASASYFHKTVGGYHAAKLRRFQDMVNFHISGEMQTMVDSLQKNNTTVFADLPVLNMLNTKYILYNPGSPPLKNNYACGPAWFVGEVKTVQTPDEEIQALSTIDPKKELVVSAAYSQNVISQPNPDTLANITLDEYGTKYLAYTSKSAVEATAVFSEVYYPLGWKCTIDGNEVDYACVNYLLRGVKVPAGEHKIEWKYMPESYTRGNLFGMAGSSLLAVFLLFTAFTEWRKRKSSLAVNGK